jgi:hypothetical protein
LFRNSPDGHAAHQPQRRVPVPLEVQDDVHQVLQHAGARDRPFLGDVTDEHDRQPAFLRERDQRGGHRADLRHAARGALDGGRGQRLHGVDHEQPGVDLVDVGEDRRDVALGGQEHGLVHVAGAFGAQPHLPGRLLTRHVQGR